VVKDSSRLRRRVLVLGTGTNVGKTFVTSHVTRLLRELRPDLDVLALKPVESGVAEEPEDAAELARACGRPPAELLPRYAFRAPLSPHLAAELEGQIVELDEITRWVSEREPKGSNTQLTLVESAGGTFSPLGAGITNADLVKALERPLVMLIAPDALGVLHDVTATTLALGTRGIRPDLVVLTLARAADESTGKNRRELERLGLGPALSLADGPETTLRAVATWLITNS
jgi:dethiobiotin synthetase